VVPLNKSHINTFPLVPSSWMLHQKMLFHKNNPMLLVIRNQTFPPFGVTVRIISLIDKMANNIAHGLKQYRI
jgi:hypothetical protein